MEIFFEVHFTLSVIFNFFIEYEDDTSLMPIRDINKIAERYIKGDFLIEALPCLPIQYLDLGGDERRFYLIKIIRIM